MVGHNLKVQNKRLTCNNDSNTKYFWHPISDEPKVMIKTKTTPPLRIKGGRGDDMLSKVCRHL